uniref:MARVEL domain-containing protein n=1 Tax=Panagrellus redivivus TaxID=6233 RepID=A0A7E4WDV1_PANRE
MAPEPTTRSLSACRVGAGFDAALDALHARKDRLRLIRESTTLYAPIVQFVVLFLSTGLSLMALLNSPKVMHDVTIFCSFLEFELFITLIVVAAIPTGSAMLTGFANVVVLWALEMLFALYLMFVDWPDECEEGGCTIIQGHFVHRLFVIVINVAFSIAHLILGVAYGVASGSLDREKSVLAEIELRTELKMKRRRRRRPKKQMSSVSISQSTSTRSETKKSSESELKSKESRSIEKMKMTESQEQEPETKPQEEQLNTISTPQKPIPITKQPHYIPRYIQSIPLSSVAPVTDGYFVPKSEVSPQRPIFIDNEIEIPDSSASGYNSSTESSYRHPS